MIEQTEAIVLKASRYSETSKILTLYTRELGRVSVIARGAMRPKSKFAGLLQPLAYVATVIYVKEGRGLQTLGSAESVRRFPVIPTDLDRTAAGLEMLELVNAALHDQERNENLFNLLLQTLEALNDRSADPVPALLQFMVSFCSVLGFSIRVDGCGICDEEVGSTREGIPFSIAAGAPLCAEHRSAAGYLMLKPGTFALLDSLVTGKGERSRQQKGSEEAAAELHDLLVRFLQFHVEGLRTLRVGGITSSMLNK